MSDLDRDTGSGAGGCASASGRVGRDTPPSGGAFFPPNHSVLPRTLGKYTLLWQLGSGGMADAYLALQHGAFGFEKLVVVKCLKPSLADESRAVQMFMDEARLGTTLTHSNIVQVFDAGATDDTHFIVMEYVEGVDLRKVRRARRGKGQPAFPLEYAIYVTSELLSGLNYAHQKRDLSGAPLGIVHRDISPGNLLLSFSGGVKITDFGVAKSALQLSERTAFGELKGKIAYMSPEQAQGQAVDLRTDLFAASAILYELGTGVRLFGNLSEVDTLALAITGEHARPRQVCRHFPEALEGIIERGLCVDRERRYPSAREMQRDLLHFAREAGLTISEAAFSDWLTQELVQVEAEQQAMLKSARSLASRAKVQQEAAEAQPSHAEEDEPVTRLTSNPPPAAARQRSIEGAPEVVTDAIEVVAVDRDVHPTAGAVASTGVDADGPSTLLGSAQSVHPASPIRVRRRRRGGARAVLVAAVVLGFAVLTLSSRGPVSWSELSGEVRSRVVEPLVSALRMQWQRLGGGRAASPGRVANGIVELDVSPGFARLWLDDQPIIVPRLSLAAGARHQLTAEAPGYSSKVILLEVGSPIEHVSISLAPRER